LVLKLTIDRLKNLVGSLRSFEVIFELAKDFHDAVAAMPREHRQYSVISTLGQAISLAHRSVLMRPSIAAPTFLNTFRWLAGTSPEHNAFMAVGIDYMDAKGPWVSATSTILDVRQGDDVPLAYSFDAPLQSLASEDEAIAVSDVTGRLELWDVNRRERIAKHQLLPGPIQAIALAPSGGMLAFIDGEYMARTVNGSLSVACSRKAHILEFCSPSELLMINPDSDLVVWDTVTGAITTLARSLPHPVSLVRVRNKGQNLFVMAGAEGEVLLLLDRKTGTWVSHQLLQPSAPVLRVDLNETGERIALACIDRKVMILDAITGNTMATLSYECHESVHAVGRIVECTFGGNQDCLFLITRDGQALCWFYLSGELEAMVNCWAPVEAPKTCLLGYLPKSQRPLMSTPSNATYLRQIHSELLPPHHDAAVSSCFITPDNKVVSMSVQDQTVRWFEVEGGRQIYSPQYVRSVSAMTQGGNANDALLGNAVGVIWYLPPSPPLPEDLLRKLFDEPITGVLLTKDGSVVAAAKSGEVKQLLTNGKVKALWRNLGMREQLKICQAGGRGVCWSLRLENTKDGNYSVVSLLKGDNTEEELYRSYAQVNDLSATDCGERICIAGKNVIVFERSGRHWMTLYQREKRAEYVAFLDDGSTLAVVLQEEPWLELWRVEVGLPTVSSILLPGSPTCLAAHCNRIAVGCASGRIFCMQFRSGIEERRGC
jgi:WD40 repeat protein